MGIDTVSSRRAAICLLILVCELNPRATYAVESDGTPADALSVLRSSAASDEQVSSTLDILQSAIDSTKEVLPEYLVDEFLECVTRRLTTLNKSLNQSITDEYRIAMLANRILELANNVTMLRFRTFDKSTDLRDRTTKQYQEILEGFEQQMENSAASRSDNIRRLLRSAMVEVLTEVQEDVLVAGYAQHLDELERKELSTIVKEVLLQAEEISTPLESDGLSPERLSAVAKVANDGRTRVRQFFRDREVEISTRGGATVAQIGREHRLLANEIAVRLLAAENLETEAVLGMARRQGEATIVDNLPSKIEEKEMDRQAREIELGQITSTARLNYSRTALILTNALAVLLLMYLWLSRNRRKPPLS